MDTGWHLIGVQKLRIPASCQINNEKDWLPQPEPVNHGKSLMHYFYASATLENLLLGLAARNAGS